MKLFIFDFDDTLFDTQSLKEDFFNMLASFDLPKKEIQSSYKKFMDENRGLYIPNNHLEKLLTEFKLKENFKNETLSWLQNLDFKKYVFIETMETLEKISKTNKIILLTKGDEEFQKLKIENCGLKKYFDEIHIVKNNKEDFVRNQNYSGEIYFINDKESENKKISDEFPHIKVFTIKTKKEVKDLLLSLVV